MAKKQALKLVKRPPLVAQLVLDADYIASVIDHAHIREWGTMRRAGAGTLCDACGKRLDEYATDDEVCGGSDGPGFTLCTSGACADMLRDAPVRTRKALYTRQRRANEARRRELRWFVYDRESKDPDDPFTITALTITRAISRMAQEAPEQLGQLLAKNADGITGSILVQLAAFDEVRYA